MKILVRAATTLGRSARKQRNRCGTEITLCRTGTGGMTRSTRCAAVCAIRRPLQEGTDAGDRPGPTGASSALHDPLPRCTARSEDSTASLRESLLCSPGREWSAHHLRRPVRRPRSAETPARPQAAWFPTSGTRGHRARAAAIPAWASSRALRSVAFEGNWLASLDGLEFQSKRVAQSGGPTGFTPIMAPSISAVQARCPGTQAAWFIPGTVCTAILPSGMSATRR